MDAFAAGPALAAALGALLLQVGSNFANDVFDAEQGADTGERIGPPRAVAMGWLSPSQMRVAMGLAFGAAVLVGLYLLQVAGWPIFAVGLVSILAGYAYTGGPWPLAYHGLGEATVFLFFGMVAVCGTVFVQSLAVSPVALVASVPVGALAAAVLVVNNLRDVNGDAAAGKRTLAVRWGRPGARAEYTALLAVSYLVPIAMAVSGWHFIVLLPLATLPRALILHGVVHSSQDGPSLNQALAETAQLALRFSMLLALGIVLAA
jgi:1,4-dihydroxy-2-naphthoate octaprenyltransferase